MSKFLSTGNLVGVKRKNNSPKTVNDFFKKVKNEKNDKNYSTSIIIPKRPIMTSSPLKTVSKTDDFGPNLKLLTCKLCNNQYDSSKHLPVMVNYLSLSLN